MEKLQQITYQNQSIFIYENPEWFTTTTDSVLLSEFISVHLRDQKIIDLGSGVGIIPLLLAFQTKAQIYGLEIQRDVLELSKKSVKINHLEDQIHLIEGDIKESMKYFKPESFDIVLSNPPYFPYNEDKVTNEDLHKKYARHEITITFEQLIMQVQKLLKPKGRFYMIHRTSRFIEILEVLKQYQLEPKKIQLIYHNQEKESELFLLEASKYGKKELRILPPLFIEERKEL